MANSPGNGELGGRPGPGATRGPGAQAQVYPFVVPDRV